MKYDRDILTGETVRVPTLLKDIAQQSRYGYDKAQWSAEELGKIDPPTGSMSTIWNLEELEEEGYGIDDYQELYDFMTGLPHRHDFLQNSAMQGLDNTLMLTPLNSGHYSGEVLIEAYAGISDCYEEYAASEAARQIAKRQGLDEKTQDEAAAQAIEQVIGNRRLLQANERIGEGLERHFRVTHPGTPANHTKAAQAAAFVTGQFFEYAKDTAAWKATAREKAFDYTSGTTVEQNLSLVRQAEKSGGLQYSFEARLILANLKGAWEKNKKTEEGKKGGSFIRVHDITRAIEEARIEVKERKKTRSNHKEYLKAKHPEQYKKQLHETLQVNITETLGENDMRVEIAKAGLGVQLADTVAPKDYLISLDEVYIRDYVVENYWKDSPEAVDAIIKPSPFPLSTGRIFGIAARDQSGEMLETGYYVTERELYGWDTNTTQAVEILLRDVNMLCEKDPHLNEQFGTTEDMSEKERKSALAQKTFKELQEETLIDTYNGEQLGFFAAIEKVRDKVKRLCGAMGTEDDISEKTLNSVLEKEQLKSFPKLGQILIDCESAKTTLPPLMRYLLKEAEIASQKGREAHVAVEVITSEAALIQDGFSLQDIEEAINFMSWADGHPCPDGALKSEHISLSTDTSTEALGIIPLVDAKSGLLDEVRELAAYRAGTSSYIGEIAEKEYIALAEKTWKDGLVIITVDRGGTNEPTPFPVSQGRWETLEPELKAHIGYALKQYGVRTPAVLTISYQYSENPRDDALYQRVEIDASAKGDFCYAHIVRKSPFAQENKKPGTEENNYIAPSTESDLDQHRSRSV